MTAASPRYDAVVVGARCAGAATAMLLARAGARVLAVDRQDYGADTLSTHALMRGGVLQLRRWGLLDAIVAAGTPPIRATSFHYGGEEVPVAIRPAAGVDALLAPRRTVLDRALADAAWEAGAEIRFGHTVTGLLRDAAGAVSGVMLKPPGDAPAVAVAAGLVVGADGRGSTVARLAGARTHVEGAHAAATVYGYFPWPETDRYRWHFGERTAASVIPTNGRLACIAVAVPPARYRAEIARDLAAGFRRILREAAPEVAAALAGIASAGPLRAFAGAPGHLREASGPGWALAGDAGAFRDPATAHGITDAFRDAELLARAASNGSAAAWRAYGTERDVLSREIFDVTDLIASFDWTLDSLRPLHRRLNEAMKAETAALVAFDAPDASLAA